MGDGLKMVAGNKLEAFLYRMTNTPLKGVALGLSLIHISKQLVAALKEAGFTEIKTYSNAKNHWISIVATK